MQTHIVLCPIRMHAATISEHTIGPHKSRDVFCSIVPTAYTYTPWHPRVPEGARARHVVTYYIVPPPSPQRKGKTAYVVGVSLSPLACTLSYSRTMVDLVRPPRAKSHPRELLRRLTSLQKSRFAQLSLDLTSMQRSRPGELLLRFVTRFSQW